LNSEKYDELLLILSVDLFYDNLNAKKQNHSITNLELLCDISNVINKILLDHCTPKTCWFVPDDEIILKKFTELKDKIIHSSDEVGYHCLIPQKIDIDNASLSELNKYIKNALKLFSYYDIIPATTRMVGCALNNTLLHSLENHGLKIDSSAIPKRKRTSNIKFDWSITSSEPYFPSKNDYRISNKNMDQCRKILEVPLSTIPIKASYDKKPLLRYLDLTFNPSLLSNKIQDIIQNNNLIVTIIHPAQLLSTIHKTDLYANNIVDFETNLLSIIKNCIYYKKRIKCLTFTELYDLIQKN